MTIADALAGRDVCGKAKTGSGKTLGFGLPMLQRLAAGTTLGAANSRPARPRGLVLLPTRELAVQVYEVLKPLGAALDFTSRPSTAAPTSNDRSRRWRRAVTSSSQRRGD